MTRHDRNVADTKRDSNTRHDPSCRTSTQKTWGPGARIALTTRSSVHLTTSYWHIIESVFHPPEQISPPPPPQNTHYFIAADSALTPKYLDIPPQIIEIDNSNIIRILARCVHPPCFIPQHAVIAQAIMIFQEPNDPSIPLICWAQLMGNDKPLLECKVRKNNHVLSITGMVDTGADVTVIPSSKWPSHWGLRTLTGVVKGIGGHQLAKQSDSIIQIEGPDGQLANVRPFVLDTGFTLWGRDVLNQWGAKLELPPPRKDF